MNGLTIPQHGKIDHVLDVLTMAHIFFCHLKVSTPPELPQLGGLRVRSRAIRSAGPVAQSLQEIQHSFQ